MILHRPAPPVWRSILYVPGNVPKFIDKAHERGADCVLVDLEDSVQPAQKPEARAMLAETMTKVARGGADVAVRINRPLRLAIPDIEAAARDSDNGTLWFTSAPTPDGAADWVSRMIAMQDGDSGVTFVVRRLEDGAAVGSTSMFHVDAANRRLEIGHTWYSSSVRRTCPARFATSPRRSRAPAPGSRDRPWPRWRRP